MNTIRDLYDLILEEYGKRGCWISELAASYGKTGQLLRVSGAAVPFRTVRSTAMLARSATGEVNTVIYLYPAC